MPWEFHPRYWPDLEHQFDRQSLTGAARAYLEHCQMSGYSDATVESMEKYLSYFVHWCSERAIGRINEVDLSLLQRYQRFLRRYRKRDGKPLAVASLRSRLGAVRSWFGWLARHNLLLYNPGSELQLPRLGVRLPRHVLTEEEAEQILAVPDVETATGARDRALLETLYGSGIRRGELVGLDLEDLDLSRATLLVRRGKSKRERLIPVGERALQWLVKYLADARPALGPPPPDETALFVNHFGRRLQADNLTRHMRRLLRASRVGKPGACHIFRHTAATLMLEGGADIRYVQELLGHSDLSSTQLYTKVSLRKLRQVHRETHPAEQSHRRQAERRQEAEEQWLALREELSRAARDEESPFF